MPNSSQAVSQYLHCFMSDHLVITGKLIQKILATTSEVTESSEQLMKALSDMLIIARLIAAIYTITPSVSV